MVPAEGPIVDELLPYANPRPGLCGERAAVRRAGSVDGAAPQGLTVTVLRVGCGSIALDLEHTRLSAGGVGPGRIASLTGPARINVGVYLNRSRVACGHGHCEIREGKRLPDIVLGRNGREEVKGELAGAGRHSKG